MERIKRRAARFAFKILSKGRNAIGYLTAPSEAEKVEMRVDAYKAENSGRLEGKVVIITGSTRGIGLAVAKGFADLGASVVINGRTQSAVDAAVADLRKASDRIVGVTADVGTVEGAKRLLDAAVSTFGTVDVLVNNAGVNRGAGKPIWEVSPEEQSETLRTNLQAPFLCLSIVTEWMIRNRVRGRVLNVSSGAGVSALEKLSPYGISKFGIEGLTKYAAQDLGKVGIAVVSIQPGSVQTDMTKEQFGWGDFQELPPASAVLPTFVFAATAPAEAINGRAISVWRYGCDPEAEPLVTSSVAASRKMSFTPLSFRNQPIERESEQITVYDRAESQFGPAPEVVEAIQTTTSRALRFYPDAEARSLRRALADEHNLPEDCFAIGPGSSELIWRMIQLFAKPSENAVANDPGWFGFDMFCARAGVSVKRVPFELGGPSNRPNHNLRGILEAIDTNTRMIYLISPSNPEGVPLRTSELNDFLQNVPPHLPVIIDEAYYEYADNEDIVDSADIVRTSNRLIVGTRTFSKFYGLAGLRVGYAIAQPRIAGLIERAGIPFNISAPAERASAAALSAKGHRETVHRAVCDERQRIQHEVGELGLDYVPSQSGSILVELPCEVNKFYKRYEESGIFLSKSAFFDGKYTMFPVGRKEQNDINLEILRSFF